LTIEQELKILSSTALWLVPPDNAPIQRHGFNASYLDTTYSLYDNSGHPRQCAQSGFYCRGHLYALVVMLFERHVVIHPDSQPSLRLVVESDNTIFYIDSSAKCILVSGSLQECLRECGM
jgi:hypothetical protein